jgi:IclR family transcriptional regulator, KDG regulon repressor
MKPAAAPRRSNYWVPMVGNAIKVLEAFHDSGVELSLHDVSSRARVSKTSALRILYTLVELGYIDRNPETGRYQLGVKLVEVSHRAVSSRSLIQIARPYMAQLRAQFDETVNLAVLRNNEIVYLEIVESRQSFRMVTEVGSRVPMHATALGKAIAAFLPPSAMRAILSGAGMQPYTARTITGMERFEGALQKIRKRGYSVDNEEAEVGALCVAASILNSDGQAIAALSVSGPVHRMKSHQRAIAQQVRKAAAAISHTLATVQFG